MQDRTRLAIPDRYSALTLRPGSTDLPTVCNVRMAVPTANLTGTIDGRRVRLLGAAVHGNGGIIRTAKRLDAHLRACLVVGVHVRAYLLLTVDQEQTVDIWLDEVGWEICGAQGVLDLGAEA